MVWVVLWARVCRLCLHPCLAGFQNLVSSLQRLVASFCMALSLSPTCRPAAAAACWCLLPAALQSLATFPDKISDSNLKAVNALKGVGKGTMERVSC